MKHDSVRNLQLLIQIAGALINTFTSIANFNSNAFWNCDIVSLMENTQEFVSLHYKNFSTVDIQCIIIEKESHKTENKGNFK